jgi:hypothetical protein
MTLPSIDAETETAYDMVNFWADAARKAGSTDPTYVRLVAYTVSLDAPQGTITLQENNYIAGNLYISQMDAVGDLFVVKQDFGLPAAPYTGSADAAYAVFGKAVTLDTFSATVTGFVFTFMSANILGIVGYTMFLFTHKDRPVVKNASFVCQLQMLVGLSGACIAGGLFAVEPYRTPHLCWVRTWLLAISFVVFYAPLIAKTYRLVKIFTSKKFNTRKYTDQHLAMYITGPGCFAQIILLIVLQIIDAPTFTSEFDATKSILYVEDIMTPLCTWNLVWTVVEFLYAAMYLIVGGYLAFLCRDLPPQYNEAPYIATCLFFMLGICVVILPLNFLVSSAEVAVVLRGMVIQFSVAVMQHTLFGIKIAKFYGYLQSTIASASSRGTSAGKKTPHQVNKLKNREGKKRSQATSQATSNMSQVEMTTQGDQPKDNDTTTDATNEGAEVTSAEETGPESV